MPQRSRMIAAGNDASLEEANGIGRYEWLPADDLLVWSPGLLRIYGRSQAPEGEVGFSALIHPEDRVRVEAETSDLLGSGAFTYSHAFRILRPDGEVRFVLDRGVIERDARGSVTAIRGMNVDLTDFVPSSSRCLQAAGAGLTEWDYGAELARWSPEAFRLFGFPPAAGVPPFDTWLAHIHPLDRDRVARDAKSFIEAPPWQVLGCEYRIIHPDRGVRWLMTRGRNEWSDDGRPARQLMLHLDVTESKAAEIRLEENEARFRSLVDLMPAAMYTVDAEGRITLFNQQAAAIWGRTPRLSDSQERFCGAFRIWRLDGTLLPHAETPMAEALRTGRSVRGQEVEMERPDRSRVVVSVNIDPLRDATGAVVGAVNVLVDVTAGKHAEARIRENEERLRLALDAADLGTWDADPRTGAAIWSRRHAELQGYPPEVGGRATVQKWRDRVHPDDLERVMAQIEEARASHGLVAVEHRLAQADPGRPRWLSLYGRFSYDAAGEPVRFSGVSRDITQRKEAEERLLQHNRQLDLLSRASHRLLLMAASEDEVLGSIFTDVAALLGTESYYYYRTIAPRTLGLHLARGAGAEERRLFGTVAFGELMCGRIAEGRERLIVEDLQQCLQPGVEELRVAGATSYAGFPLLAEGELIGTLSFVSRTRTHFRDGDIKTVQAICDQIAVTLERRRLQRKVQDAQALSGFLLRLSDALRSLVNAGEIQGVAARLLGEELGASRTAYYEIDGDSYVIGVDYAWQVPSMAGHYPVAAFGADLLERHRRGGLIVVTDVKTAHSDAEISNFQAIQVAAYIGVPLVKEGRFVAGFTVQSQAPRVWTATDVKMAEETAERTWAAVARARAEQHLHESEDRFRLLAEGAPVLMWVSDENGCVSVNRAYRTFLGVGSDLDVKGYDWSRFVHPDDRDVYLRAYSDAVAKAGNFDAEFRFRCSDGAYRWMRSVATPRRDAAGRVRGYVGATIDIDDAKLGAETMRRAHDTFRRLVEGSPFGIYTVDADFRLALVSAGAKKVFENVHPLIGRDFAEVLRIIWPEPFAGAAIAQFRNTLATGESYHAASTVERRADIEATEAYDWKIERITMPDGRPGVVCQFYDLSERQAHAEKIRHLMREVNHRAKNMLTLVGAVARQTASVGMEGFLDRFGERVRALATSQDMLMQTDWDGADLAALIKGQLRHFKELIGNRIVLSGPPVRVSSNAAQTLGLAFHELATNAAKYGSLSNSSGCVDIAWQITEDPGGFQFRISWTETKGPSVIAPSRTGFGQRLATTVAEASLFANVTLQYAQTGVVWTLLCPLARIAGPSFGIQDGERTDSPP